MANKDLWNYYMATRSSVRNPTNTTSGPSSPPYDNLTVIDASPTISLQPTQRSQHQTPLIPGPTRPIQQGLFRKRVHNASVMRGETSQTRSTQDFIREVINEPLQADPDFSTPRWTSTIDYIIREGSYNSRRIPFWTQIGEIHPPMSQFVKVKKVVAMISELTPNGQGDMLVTLKDPSGKIEGSMHHNIFLNNEYRIATTVGAVVILRNVTVCRFTMSSNCLNITRSNIVKVIGVNSMIAEYEPTEGVTIKEEYDASTEHELETVPDSDVDE